MDNKFYAETLYNELLVFLQEYAEADEPKIEITTYIKTLLSSPWFKNRVDLTRSTFNQLASGEWQLVVATPYSDYTATITFSV